MWKNLGKSLMLLSLDRVYLQLATTRRLAWIATYLVTAQVLILQAQAQQLAPRTITVLIESNFQVSGRRFLEEVHRGLAPGVREAVRFETVIAQTTEMPARLQGQWE